MFSCNWDCLQKKTPSENTVVGGFHSVNESQWIMVRKNNHFKPCRFYLNLKLLQSLYYGQSFFLYSGIVHLVCIKRFREETYRMFQSVFVFLEQDTSSWNPQTASRERNVLFNNALNTFYLRLHGVRHMVNGHSDSEKGNPLPPHRRLTARVLLYAPSHRQDNTYHSLCYTSRGTLIGTRNSSMRPP